ncbi:stage II sporulation protein [Gracilibacillus halophilus YIM-C55.5]|uniref:Stage II sporulation protein n=1 Tax=Gracilibacillus halophilus YIM-C55.5 TaxID=1308866 RepID=N4WKA1_9BACI|nr:M23 family metallopeptidase [Gracilibacillus halophilus]ENH96562.1 stage II sporulation protein [Gracilibacillus halophilus YIM-C55.5]
MEENKNVSKNRWKRLFKKKWFFPALYLTVAALLITGVLWYQNAMNQVPDIAEDMEEELNDSENATDEESAPVMQQQEVLQLPVAEDLQTQIVTKFYDYQADAEAQQKGLIHHQNRYYQSDGIAISTDDHQAFDVMASLSGTVSEVKQDPLLGNVVKMDHAEDISTYYASLEEVLVENGDEVEQGQSIGTAGQNTLGQDNGVHVHFEVRKADTPVNPETFINEPISQIVLPDDASETESTEDEANDSKNRMKVVKKSRQRKTMQLKNRIHQKSQMKMASKTQKMKMQPKKNQAPCHKLKNPLSGVGKGFFYWLGNCDIQFVAFDRIRVKRRKGKQLLASKKGIRVKQRNRN